MTDLEWVKMMRASSRQVVTRFHADKTNRAMLKDERKGGQPGYNGATFLFIRAFEGDDGARPFSPDAVFWLSPDIELFDPAGVRIVTTDIKAGTEYEVEVVVTNMGDLDCNACQVELYLDDPSIGFCVSASKLLGSRMIAVGRESKAAVSFPFTATEVTAGHRCMFARASSILTNDYPADWVGFNASDDRHLGQQNLNIVRQGTGFDLNVQLGAAFRDKPLTLTLQPNMKPFRTARMAALGRYLMLNKTATLAGFSIERKEIAHPSPSGGRRAGTAVAGLAREGKNRWAFRSLFDREPMRVNVPQLGLRPNEAVPIELRLADPAIGKVEGGITLLVVG